MRNFLISLGVVLVAAAAAFGASFVLNDNPDLRRAARDGDAMAWLRTEFRLDDTQFAAIRKLHDDYGAVCAEHCLAITNAREGAAAAAELAQLEKACVDAMTAHFQRVAAVMGPPQGERYLATVLPRIAAYAHANAPTVQATP
jgi:hypothetical protein